jgi:hypothetical protein
MALKMFGDLDINGGLEAVAALPMEFEKEVQIGSTLKLNDITFMAGPVPIIITPSLALKAKVVAKFEAKATLSGFSLRYRKHVEFGTRYRSSNSNGFVPINPSSFSKVELATKPTLDIEGSASVQFSIIPEMNLTLWKVAPLCIRPEPYIRIDTSFGSDSKCSNTLVPYYETSWGFDTDLSLQRIKVPVLGQELTVAASLLPLTLSMNIIDKRPLECKWCAGCMLTTAGAYYWRPDDWGSCVCSSGNGGTQTRGVQCVTGVTTFGTDTDCATSGSKPDDQRSCACTDTQCPSSCKAEWINDEMCDAACSTRACGYDGGDCPNMEEECAELTSCAACVLNSFSMCGWCESSQTCLLDKGLAENTCAIADWRTNVCAAEEHDLVLQWPNDPSTDPITAGGTYSIKWAGGPTNGKVRISYRYDDGLEVFSGFGIPEQPVDNKDTKYSYSSSDGTHTYSWKVEGGITSSDQFQIMLYSEEDPSNFILGEQIKIDGVLRAYRWRAGPWSACAGCSGGTQTRQVVCTEDSGCVSGEQVTVSGSQYLSAQMGTYTKTGVSSNGKPYYKFGSYFLYSKTVSSGMIWAIGATLDSTTMFTYAIDSADTPDKIAEPVKWSSKTTGLMTDQTFVVCGKTAGDGQCNPDTKTLLKAEQDCKRSSDSSDWSFAREKSCGGECPQVHLCKTKTCNCQCMYLNKPSSGINKWHNGGATCSAYVPGFGITGCDTTQTKTAGYQYCCKQKDLKFSVNGKEYSGCDDGCTGKAKWTEQPSASCSKTCGGGKTYVEYKCMGWLEDDTAFCNADLTDEAGTHKVSDLRGNCEPGHRYDMECTGWNPGGGVPFCAGDDPSGEYECNTQPCLTYSWNVTDWSTCTKGCGGGDRARSVTCVSSDGTEPPYESKCTGSKPPESEACNTEPCDDIPLGIVIQTDEGKVGAGSVVDISWTGGTQYGNVGLKICLAAVSGSLDSCESAWCTTCGMPSGSLDNTGAFRWNVPSAMASGKYLVRVSSATNSDNYDETKGFTIRGLKTYTSAVAVTPVVTFNARLFGALGTHEVWTIPGTGTGALNILDLGQIGAIEVWASASWRLQSAVISTSDGREYVFGPTGALAADAHVTLLAVAPTLNPTSSPTSSPTSPTAAPTSTPKTVVTVVPSSAPSAAPTSLPTTNPTSPTAAPTSTPKAAATVVPSSAPTATTSTTSDHISLVFKLDGENVEQWALDSTQSAFELAIANSVRYQLCTLLVCFSNQFTHVCVDRNRVVPGQSGQRPSGHSRPSAGIGH